MLADDLNKNCFMRKKINMMVMEEIKLCFHVGASISAMPLRTYNVGVI